MNPFDTIKRAHKKTESIAVAFSIGKDSLAVLDLCTHYFKRVEAFFMYLVKGLEFQEKYLRYAEHRWSLKIRRLPHWCLSDLLKRDVLRPYSEMGNSCKKIKIIDIEDFIRKETGLFFIAYGHKVIDSLSRRGFINAGGDVDEQHGRVYPLAWWNNAAVYNYLKFQKIPLPHEYISFGRSLNTALHAEELIHIKKFYPSDFQKILEVFPYAEAVIKQQEFRGLVEVPKVRGGHY